MEFLFAPMEGVTNATYRRVHSGLFGGDITYFSPFIAPDAQGTFKQAFLRELMPDNNEGIRLVPQILANNPDAFIIVANKLKELGYNEINLNAGCPSGTVFAKHKGSGMLVDPVSYGAFLDRIFDSTDLNISIKTRMGVSSTDEFDSLMELYNKYPIHRLIVHARNRDGMYRSKPDIETFARAAVGCSFPVYYNGNIFSPADHSSITAKAPFIDGVMIGRGAVANPALFRIISGGSGLTAAELKNFHDTLLEAYLSQGLFADFAVSRMKELWYYMIYCFPDSTKQYKALNKSRKLDDYRSAVNILFSSCQFKNTWFAG